MLCLLELQNELCSFKEIYITDSNILQCIMNINKTFITYIVYPVCVFSNTKKTYCLIIVSTFTSSLTLNSNKQ